MWTELRLWGFVLATSGCGWLSDAEVADWLEGATCEGGADAVDVPGCVPHYADDDADGYGGERTRCLCDGTDEYPVSVGGDCDDTDPTIHPGAVEVCDVDLVDEDCDPTTVGGEELYYLDVDGDGYGTDQVELLCAPDEAFRATVAGDCDDGDAEVSSDRSEICDGIDNDCDPETTEAGLVTIEGGATFSSDLQAAIDAAAPGAVLTVCPGTYGPIEVWKSLQISGLEDAASTIIDAGGSGSAVLVTGGSVELDDLTVTGGAGQALGSALRVGGGVYVAGGGVLVARRVVVTGNAVDGSGGGIYATGEVLLEDSLIYDNAARLDGGGIFAADGPVRLVGANLFYNQAERGAGLYLQDADLTLEDARISGNFGETGGGVYVDGGATLAATDDTVGAITSNSATVLGAGVAVTAPGETVELRNVSLADNVAPARGGGAAVTRGTLVSTGSHWVGTAAEDCSRANYQEDVYIDGQSYCAGDAADFTCAADTCTGSISTDCACPQ